MKSVKVFISVIIALILSFLGFSKTGLISENNIPDKDSKDKLSLSENAQNEFCSADNKVEDNSPLFINCAGFLE